MARTNNPYGLPDRQWQFVQEYLIDLDGTAAYLRAGYQPRRNETARVEASKLLTKPNILAALTAERTRLASLLEITPEKVLREYARLAFSDMRKYVTWGTHGIRVHDSSALSEDQARAVGEVSETVGEKTRTFRFKLHDKKGALDSLAKHLDLFHEYAAAKEVGAGLAGLLEEARQQTALPSDPAVPPMAQA